MISYGKNRFPQALCGRRHGWQRQIHPAALLHQWLKAEGYPVFFSEWNSSALVKDTTNVRRSATFSHRQLFPYCMPPILPNRTETRHYSAFESWGNRARDRYIYTAFARERGSWLQSRVDS